ncbi:flagellar FliJ family protein [Limnohabitans sp.]|jgi:flagellar export protein FliJ|uniref:flagellar FliJ family protein n=1 Tax=Limnohabitans sp. TaxID=1907725 RepID=UPI00286EDB31|nr:flagellar FliJ family protein [Limnohabitans sp.]
MKPRAAWPILAKKAKEKCEEAQAEVVKSRERVAHLEQSRERMEMLYLDYVHRSKEAEKKLHSMAETLNYRGFMQQVKALVLRVDADLAKANQDLDDKKFLLLAAEKKRIQMETLMEQDLKQVRAFHQKREQREMDAAGVMLYNLKS